MSQNWRKLQEKFVELMREKIPSKNLINVLLDVLPLEKESIYRRLRGDIPFTFMEIATLASQLGISLDSIVVLTAPYRTELYRLHVRDYSQFNPIDLYMSESYIQVIEHVSNNPYSEFGIAANVIPLHISLMHLPLYYVYILKWRYQFGISDELPLKYSNIHIPEREREFYDKYLKAISGIKYTYFIWDTTFILSLINDIKYFYMIQLIDKEEMYMLKQELERMINTLEQFTDSGEFPISGNKVETYISFLNFDTSYTYLESDNVSISMSNAYGLGAYTSLEKEACEKMKTWIQGLKKTSILISGTSQLEKIKFFKQQRSFLEQHFNIEDSTF